MFRHELRGCQYWLNGQPIELGSPIVRVEIFRDQIADLGLPPFDHGGKTAGLAFVYVRDGTAYDIGSTGTILRTGRRSSPFPLGAGLDADVPIAVEGRTLTVGDKIVPVSAYFREIVLVRNVIVVTREPAGMDDIRNVYGVDTTGHVIWVIGVPDSIGSRRTPRGPLPFNSIGIKDDGLVAYNGDGRILALDIATGHIGDLLGWWSER